jgi:ATP-dependent exoDNAse (exonuclease V) alpha subunit
MAELQEYAFRILAETNHSVFLTGKAGTGKSTFLREVVVNLGKKSVVLAPTGIAAIHIRGETIHAFFKLPFGPIPPGDSRLRQIRYPAEKKRMMTDMEVLIIDEVSMVRADLLDAVDSCLRRIRKDHRPFGGVQVLLVGDLLQLEPVSKTQDREMLDAWYRSPFFFDARVWVETSLVNIELEKVYRQQDLDFIALLDRIRKAEPTYEDMVTLNHLPKSPPMDDQLYCITLTGTRSSAESTNRSRLQELAGEVQTYKGIISGDFPLHHLPTEERLELKPGAQVIFNRNDIGAYRRWVNGTLGVVIDTMEDNVMVRLRDGKEYKVEPVRWEHIRYTQDREGKIVEDIIGSFDQLPLSLAWAVTIHKSQGLTFDRVCIDLGNGAFAAGQLYVALSRCRSMEGLFLKRRLRRQDAMAREEVLRFYDQMNDLEGLKDLLEGC